MKNYIFFLSIAFLTFGFRNHLPATTTALRTGAIQRIDSMPGLCPYLSGDNKGNLLMSWVRQLNDSSAEFCYAKFNEKHGRFGPAMAIPGSRNIQPHAENLPKIIARPSGDLLALWGAANPNPKNKYAGAVYYAQSFDQGNTWSGPQKLVAETDGIDQRYYDVALLPSGEVGIIWLDNRKTTTKEGSGLYFSSTLGRNGFQPGHLIAEPCCQCCRTKILVDKDGSIHVLFRGIVQDSIRDMVYAVSSDNGKSFSTPKRISTDNWVIAGCPHTGPSMTFNDAGTHFAWFTGGPGKGCYYTRSTNKGKSFELKEKISSTGSHPQILDLLGSKLLIAWDEPVSTGGVLNRRIAIQWRASSGSEPGSSYISPATSNLSYPVLAALSASEALVGFGIKEGDRSYVGYMSLSIN